MAPAFSAWMHMHPWDTERLTLPQIVRYLEWMKSKVGNKDG